MAEIALATTDNAAIVSVPSAPVGEAAAQQAVEQATAKLTKFLNAQFIDTRYWFSARPIKNLLTPAAMAGINEETQTGLGALALKPERVVTGKAGVSKAIVVMDVDRPLAVTLSYRAELTATLEDGTKTPVIQRGDVTLLPGEDGWRVQALDVTTEAPGVSK